MSQAQAIFAQAAAPKYSVGETIGTAVTQAVEWLGRTVTYIANVLSDFAVTAWKYSVAFFEMAVEFVNQNQQAFSYVGAAATVGAVGFVIAKVLGVGSKQPEVAEPAQKAPVVET